jgi:amino acid transporter
MKPQGAATLERRLGLAEALGISVAIISPSIGMAFNVVLLAQVAGVATPLAFALGTLVMIVVALSFVAFSRRQSHAGAAYAFVAHAFGAPMGAMAGWAMLLSYACYCIGLAILAGTFTTAALACAGLHLERWSLPVSEAAILAGAILAWRDVRLAGRLMLAMEAISVTAILILAATILARLPLADWSWAPFSGRSAPTGWSGIGFALVFAVLSFAGFEGAATLGEEAMQPQRTIPRAMLGSVIGSGVMYVIVSYAVILGFGITKTADLAHASAPLDTLARRMIGTGFAGGLDISCAISAFSGVIGSLSGGVRVLYAMSRGGLWPALAKIDRVHHTPARAVIVCALAAALTLLVIPFGVGADDLYGDTAEVGTLGIIAVYACVTIAETVEAAYARRAAWVALGAAGSAMLAWAMVASLLPTPGSSSTIWALSVIGWLALGGVLLLVRPQLRRWKE